VRVARRRGGVDIQRAGADQAGQLASRLAALQIHLKEAVLRVEEAERARHVFARRAGDGRDAQRIAIDAHLSREPGDRGGATQLRQAGADLRARIEASGENQQAGCGQQYQRVAKDSRDHGQNSAM
jgi:hypothetical protein